MSSGDLCKSCGEPLIWRKTPAGKWMPTEASTGDPHWAKCPQAAEWRRRK